MVRSSVEEGMTIIARTSAPRRRPAPPVDRYRAIARATRQKRARRTLPPLLTGLIWGAVLASAALVADTALVGIGYATGSFGNFVTNLIPDAVPADLTVTETTGQVNAAPLLDATPQFTKSSALVVQGIVPSFGRAADRKVSIALNGGAPVLDGVSMQIPPASIAMAFSRNLSSALHQKGLLMTIVPLSSAFFR